MANEQTPCWLDKAFRLGAPSSKEGERICVCCGSSIPGTNAQRLEPMTATEVRRYLTLCPNATMTLVLNRSLAALERMPMTSREIAEDLFGKNSLVDLEAVERDINAFMVFIGWRWDAKQRWIPRQ